jgi:hypothetical protein
MKIENYLIVENDIVINIVLWDGNTQTWMPPENSIALAQAITPAMIWSLPTETIPSVLIEVIGAGDVGFTWDGNVLTTNAEQPPYVPPITA